MIWRWRIGCCRDPDNPEKAEPGFAPRWGMAGGVGFVKRIGVQAATTGLDAYQTEYHFMAMSIKL